MVYKRETKLALGFFIRILIMGSFGYSVTFIPILTIFTFPSGEPFDYTVRMTFIEIERKLGEGGFGEVYLGNDKLLGQEVAIKVLNFGTNIKNAHMITKEIEALG